MLDLWTGPLSYINPIAYFTAPAASENQVKDPFDVDLEKGEGTGYDFDSASLAEKIEKDNLEIQAPRRCPSVSLWKGPLSYINPVAYFWSPAQSTSKTPLLDVESMPVINEETEVSPKKDLEPFMGYPKIEPYVPYVFRFETPTLESSSPITPPLDGFTLVESTPFKQGSLPEVGIPHPIKGSGNSVSNLRKTAALDSRATQGKVVKWWSFFKRSSNGKTLPGKSDFSKAMMNFSSRHDVTLVSTNSKGHDKFQNFVRDHDEAHHQYLKALEGPAAILQDEIGDLPIKDQVKYYEAATSELTDVSKVRDREWKKKQVTQDFKSEALVRLVDSTVSRILRFPTELLQVHANTVDHLMPFAFTGGKSEPYVLPVRHEVVKGRPPIVMSPQEHSALRKQEMAQKISPDYQKGFLTTLNQIKGMVFEKAIPEIDRLYAPKSIEELEEKMKTSQINLSTKLNEVLDTGLADSATYEEISSLVDEQRFLTWMHIRHFPTNQSSLSEMNKLSPEALFNKGVANLNLKYYGLLGVLTHASKTLPGDATTKAEYSEKVKAYLPLQAAMCSLNEALKGSISMPFGGDRSLSFDPIRDQEVIQLDLSDLS